MTPKPTPKRSSCDGEVDAEFGRAVDQGGKAEDQAQDSGDAEDAVGGGGISLRGP